MNGPKAIAAAAVVALAMAAGYLLRGDVVPDGTIAPHHAGDATATTSRDHDRLSTLVSYQPALERSESAGIGTSGVALPDFRRIVRENQGAVVSIDVRESGRQVQPANPFADDPDNPFNDFFRRFQPPGGFRTPPRQGVGSGFIVSRDGKILTNAHVVKDADQITVRLSDRREFRAKLIGLDERSDVALIQIEGGGEFPTVRIGDSDRVEVGEWVMAMGTPFSLDFSATQGIVSATGRQLPNENYVPFIQTDAAVNPGNSGGPLFNLAGEVIGINSQIYSRSGGYMGLSFAIPINTAMQVARQLETKGYVERGWLGIGIQNVDPRVAERFGLDRPTGALVGQVSPDTPAERAGIKTGDVILRFDGRDVQQSGDLPPLVAATEVGKTVPVELMRDGKRMTVNVKIGKLPEDPATASTRGGAPRVDDSGDIAVAELSAEQRQQLGLERGGVIVTGIKPDSPAADVLRRGDVILEVNRERVNDVKSFTNAMKKVDKNRTTLFLVRRGQQQIFIPVEGLG